MKKTAILIFMLFFLSANWANAEWHHTVTWTKSVGPNLVDEDVLLDGVEILPADILGGKCTDVLPADPSNCVFKTADRSGQEVSIRSSDGTNQTIYLIGGIGVGPNPASGGSVTSVWIP